MDKRALYSLSYGVYIVSTWDKGRAVGCVANSVMQVTSSPATVALSLNVDNYTNACIKESGYFAVSTLPETDDIAPLIGTFGYKSSRDTDKFEGVDTTLFSALPVPSRAMAHITCRVADKMEAGSHTVFLGEVTDAALKDGKPLTYDFYRNVIKGKAPKNAPTYQAD